MIYDASIKEGTLSGIYCIETPDSKKYIGSAYRIRQRFLEHRSRLLKGCHHSPYLQNYCNKNGISSLRFYIMELCDTEALLIQEQAYIDKHRPVLNGTTNVRRPNLGKKASPELRQKLSLAAKNRPPVTQEFRDKISSIVKGRRNSEEHIRKIKDAQKGRPLKKEHCLKLSEAAKKRKKECNVTPVVNVETGALYSSIKEAWKEVDMKYPTFLAHLRGRIKNKTKFKILDTDI